MSDWIKNKPKSSNLWEDLGAGGYSALDEVLMGLPSFLVKNIGGKENWGKFDQFRKDHQLASNIGGGLGFLGSMLIPAGGIAKLAGKGAGLLKLGKLASKLDKAGDVAKMTTKGMTGLKALKQGAKSGAIQALEQAVPRALTGLEFGQGYTGEDLAKSAMKGVGNIGTGAAFGGATGATIGRLFDKLGPRIKSGVEDIGDNANALYLKKLGGTAKDIAEKFGGKGKGLKGGSAIQGVDDYMGQLVKFGKSKKLHIEPEAEAFAKDLSDRWNALSDNYNAADIVHNVDDYLTKQPVIDAMENFAGEEDTAAKMLSSITSQLNKKKSAGAQKAFLDDLTKRAYQSVNPADAMRGELAAAVKETVDDTVLKMSGLPDEVMAAMKKEYSLAKPLLNMAAKKKFTLPALGGGSPTQEKQLVEKLAAPILGAVAGTGTQGGDLSDPETWAKKAQAGLVGAVGGAALNKGAAGLKTLLQQKLGSVVGSKPVADIISKGAQGILPKLSGAMPSKLDAMSQDLATGGGGGGEAGTPEQEKAATTELEAGMSAPDKAEAVAEFTDQYKQTIKNQLVAGWEKYYKNNPDFAGITFEQFAEMVKKKTGGFDPVKSSKVLFPDNPEMEAAYLKKYQTMLYLKNLDAETALTKDPGILGFGGGYADEDNYQKIRDLMINIASGGKIENMDSASMQKMVDEDLKRVSKVQGSRKTALIGMLTNKYGLDFSDLANLGVV